MRRAYEHILNEVLFSLLHTRYALTATLLQIIYIYRLTLDISDISIGKYTFFFRNKVLYIHFSAYRLNGSSSLIAVFFLDSCNFFLDYFFYSLIA